jgi:two-component system sensor histidine kinase CreC
MRHKLEGKAYVETLMHTMAHELKSPIAAIQGSAELLSEDMPLQERQRFLNNIIEQNQRQKQLIDKLLALVRVEKQQSLAQSSSIELTELLNQVLLDFYDALQSKHIAIQTSFTPQRIQGDQLLLRQALGNLLDNAIAFTPEHGRIQISMHRSENQIAVHLQDNGAGIPEYALPKIFDRFYSLARPQAAKSTGLGLPFVREVAHLHHAEIYLENLADGGVLARFCFSLSAT